jgi:hypothetical protein
MSNSKGNEATLKKFQPKWHSGMTRTIRVPIALADQILEYAHKIDESPSQVDEDDLSYNDESEPSSDEVIKLQAKVNERLLTENRVLKREIESANETLTQVIALLKIISISERFTKRLRARLIDEGIIPLEALTQVK